MTYKYVDSNARRNENVLSVDFTFNGDVTMDDAIAQIDMMVSNLPARDSLFLRKHIDKNEPGIDMSAWMDCPSCLEHSEVRLPLGAAFFWPDE